MWPILLTSLLFVLATTNAAATPDDDNATDVSSEEGTLGRLTVNAFSIIRLEKRLEVIREKLSKASHVDHQRTYGELSARVKHLEERHCQENELECGDRSAECVYELFVCDGHKDCSNGYDEDETVCSIEPALAGRTYSGKVHWTSCDERPDHPLNITILGYRIRKYSSSIIWLKALIETSFQKDGKETYMAHTAIGHYKFARRQMVLLGEGIGRENAAFCDFYEGEDKRTNCKLLRVATLDECATMYLTLQE